jgi:hypothetical protein
MPTAFLDKFLSDLFLQSLVDPQNPSANLMATNPKLSQLDS